MSSSFSSLGSVGSVKGEFAARTTTRMSVASAWRPHFVSKLKDWSPRPLAPTVARRSPWVSAPKDSRRRATAQAKRFSPPTLEMRNLYSGAEDWFDRWDRPSCWMALSADQGSSSVRCTRRRWFGMRRSAWSEMPADAASEMMATSFSPSQKHFFSCMFCISSETPFALRCS